MKGPLEGYRVLEWAAWYQGPLAGQMLGDLGAEVIKIEDPVTGDPQRGLAVRKQIGGMQSHKEIEKHQTFYFDHVNRNKKSITVNVKKQQGRELIYDLVKKSDVFLQNFRPDVAPRLGLDSSTLSIYNPRLIYASATGWGPKGPDVLRPSYDFTGVARSGIMTVNEGEPFHLQAGIADHIGAIMTSYAVVTGLLMREKSGMGHEVQSSMLGSMVTLLGMLVDFKLYTGEEQGKWARSKARNPLWNFYQCKDGKWLSLGLLQPDRYWPDLCRALGIQYLENDSRFAKITERDKNTLELIPILDKVFAAKTRAEWLDILSKNGDLIFEPVNTISDLVEDPQVWANDYIVNFQRPDGGNQPMVGFPMHFKGAELSVRLPAPECGQHTEEVLQDILGYSWDNITKLKDEGVI
jgi:CoA:oxalate CoA-transferase